MIASTVDRWLLRTAVRLLQQGITPKKLALSVALGITIGIFPVLGSTTLLCALAGLAGGLNQPVIQSVNYGVYPLQLLLLIPFFRFGEILFGVAASQISLRQVRALIHQSIPDAIRMFWGTTWHAVAAWCLVAPFLIVIIYLSLLPVFRLISSSKEAQ